VLTHLITNVIWVIALQADKYCVRLEWTRYRTIPLLSYSLSLSLSVSLYVSDCNNSMKPHETWETIPPSPQAHGKWQTSMYIMKLKDLLVHHTHNRYKLMINITLMALKTTSHRIFKVDIQTGSQKLIKSYINGYLSAIHINIQSRHTFTHQQNRMERELLLPTCVGILLFIYAR